jgi:SAM-dependent methyltransferase
LEECRPEAVLDVGCNEGHFSRIAAESGARVVAIDYDPAVAGRVWRCARAEKLDILPLVVDLTRPTPGIGWRNQECASFLDRARGHFDLVMMLAVIHHMTVTERIPLAATLELAASMTRTHALIEFVGPEDPMFRRLVRGRDLLYRHLTVDEFEREAGCFFNTIRIHRLPGLDRWLFLLGKK